MTPSAGVLGALGLRSAPAATPSSGDRVVHRLGEENRDAFAALGYNQRRPFFAHEVRFVPRAGPDALALARWTTRVRRPDRLWMVLLTALPPALDGLPDDLFDDDEILWHRQSLGLRGHVAYACIAEDGDEVVGLSYVSDLVQRIGRRRELKTRVENRFRGWSSLLFNAVLHFAASRGRQTVRSPSADLVLRHADPARRVGRPLFERVYDRTPARGFGARRRGDWWVVDVEPAASRRVPPERATEPWGGEPGVLLFHDVERGSGHRRSDPAFAAEADRRSPAALERILAVEAEAGVRGTYDVVGTILPDVEEAVAAGGHALAFHSFDHGPGRGQLRRCREVDYRLEGYRPPRSRLTRELRGREPCLRNFTWIASSRESLGHDGLALRERVARIPIAADDYPLFRHGVDYEAWEADVLARLDDGGLRALALHDCYAHLWLPRLPRLLDRLAERGRFRTADEVVAEQFLAAAV